ncbi:hypothetical protein IFM89_008708 [Coptis chinensis]|uniref:Uncharacterized protein n=1 Tax=Coptis chinensis TaxID=261450 RepID=A0A835GWU9_9MAGN|nr:hypothetical protein IFM89_008708 [Coptis chinensis]
MLLLIPLVVTISFLLGEILMNLTVGRRSMLLNVMLSTSIECDTFMPPVDHSIYQPWYSSFLLVENNILLSYFSYIHVRQSALESVTSNNGDISNGSNSVKLEIDKSSSLPKMIFEKHEKYMYLKLVQDIISNGIQKDDRTGIGTLSKFGCQV